MTDTPASPSDLTSLTERFLPVWQACIDHEGRAEAVVEHEADRLGLAGAVGSALREFVPEVEGAWEWRPALAPSPHRIRSKTRSMVHLASFGVSCRFRPDLYAATAYEALGSYGVHLPDPSSCNQRQHLAVLFAPERARNEVVLCWELILPQGRFLAAREPLVAAGALVDLVGRHLGAPSGDAEFDTFRARVFVHRAPIEQVAADPVGWFEALGEAWRRAAEGVGHLHQDPAFEEAMAGLFRRAPERSRFHLFRFGDLDASVGLALREGILAVHLVTGGTTNGRRRNPQRRDALARLLVALHEHWPAGRVLASESARTAGTPTRIDAPVAGPGLDALRQAFAQGGNYRFDFWVADVDAGSLAEAAEVLGLGPVGPSAVEVTWPGGSVPTESASPADDDEVPPTAEWGELADKLRRSRNLVLEGVPGVGKTFAARQIVRAWGGSESPDFRAMTLHPSSSYEDFVEGIRPVAATPPEGAAAGEVRVRNARVPPSTRWFFEPVTTAAQGWGVTDGWFLRACVHAARHPEVDHVILLDELNRANVPKVLGDLLTTLEGGKRATWKAGAWDLERCTPVTLQASRRAFFVPGNVYVLATQNTTDQSVAPLDAALRRRFHFHRLEPLDPDDLAACLAGIAGREVPVLRDSVEVWSRLNDVLGSRIGPDALLGHSYLIDAALAVGRQSEDDDDDVSIVLHTWEHELLPQLGDTVERANKAVLLAPDGEIAEVLAKAAWLPHTVVVEGHDLFARARVVRANRRATPAPAPGPVT